LEYQIKEVIIGGMSMPVVKLNDVPAIKRALEGRGEIKEVNLNFTTGELIIKFADEGEWAILKQDAFRQWEVRYYSASKGEKYNTERW
jgi:hypothetical protein